MKILFAANLSTTNPNASQDRKLGLHRMGHEMVDFDAGDYRQKNWLLQAIDSRLMAGPNVERMNRDLLQVAREVRPDVFWADKLLMLQPITLAFLQEMGITTVSYMTDNPVGLRTDSRWRLYRECFPFFDLHVSKPDSGVVDYKLRGAKSVAKVVAGYDPTVHFPSLVRLTDKDRNQDVSFIGSSSDDRAKALAFLADAGLAVTISGDKWTWERALGKSLMDRLHLGDEPYGNAFRDAVWKSKINLSFATKSNLDDYTQKPLEIAGCGGFQIMERHAALIAKFVEDEEAVFFSNFEELKAKIVRYLPDEAARSRIAAAGHVRAVRDCYQYEGEMSIVLDLLGQILTAKRTSGRWPCPHVDGP